jgi:AraC-like DNA-binding protein
MLSLLSERACHVDMTVRSLARNGGSAASSGVCVQRMFLTGGLSAQRTPELMSDGNDDMVLHIHQSGRRIVSQLRREATVEPGFGVLTSNGDASTIVLPEPARFVCVGLPRSVMRASTPAIEDALVRSLPPDAGVLRLLLRYLEVLDDEGALRTPELQLAVVTHIHDLCALAVGAARDAADLARGRGLRAARLRALRADILRNLHDGNLSAGDLAKRQGVSARYVHKLFEGEGTTLSKFILGLRLQRVHGMLSDPRHADLTIGTIAYKVGFGDLSTFNREFRRRYGATPKEVRAAGS